MASEQGNALKLSSLSPGAYTIHFRLGAMHEHYPVQSIHFVIHKPYWETVWFKVLLAFVLIGIVYLVFRWRTNELKQKTRLLEEKVENEKKYHQSALKAIRAQMNPHFFYNALNTIQSFIYSNDKKNASTYLSKFSKLTRTILEMSEKENITLSEEIAALTLYLEFEQVRFNHDFNFSINCAPNIQTDKTCLPPMLIQPYVENSIKHGLLHKKEAKELKIDVELQGKILVVTVDDNGVGRKQSIELNTRKKSKHQSFATQANQQRMDLLKTRDLHATVSIEDKYDIYGQATGTRVILRIPITELH
jgi:LytS/YehU family sensor histidine kinase